MKKNILIITLVVSIGVVAAGVAMINSSSKDSGSSAVIETVDSNKNTTDNTENNSNPPKVDENVDSNANNTANNTENTTPSSNDASTGETTVTEVKVSNESVSVAIGEVKGAVGSEVIVPLTITEAPKSGIGSCDFKVNYDHLALELVEITPGDVLVNPEANFNTNIDKDLGIASFLYLDDTFATGTITKNGVFANLKFKIKDGATGAKEIAFKSIGVFTDSELSTHEVKTTNGKVNIN